MGLGVAATDQVTHQQELPTHCAKTETAGGEDTGSSDLLPKQDPGLSPHSPPRKTWGRPLEPERPGLGAEKGPDR